VRWGVVVFVSGSTTYDNRIPASFAKSASACTICVHSRNQAEVSVSAGVGDAWWSDELINVLAISVISKIDVIEMAARTSFERGRELLGLHGGSF
jgi:hypothetical protein